MLYTWTLRLHVHVCTCIKQFFQYVALEICCIVCLACTEQVSMHINYLRMCGQTLPCLYNLSSFSEVLNNSLPSTCPIESLVLVFSLTSNHIVQSQEFIRKRI